MAKVVITTMRSLLAFWKCERRAEEFEERSLTGITSANDEDAAVRSEQSNEFDMVEAYLKGVGSLLLRTLLGVFIVLTRLLA